MQILTKPMVLGAVCLLVPFLSFSQNDWDTSTSGQIIYSNGNVGIGTTSPSSKLDIEKNFNGSAFLEVTNSNTGNLARRGIYIGNGTSGNAVALISTSPNYTGVASWQNAGILSTDSKLLNGLILRSSTGGISFQPGGTSDKITFTDVGNVGIGTTTPSEKLEVAGTIYSQEVRVDIDAGTGPDYVFEENYNLRTLEETEVYIQTNKHLPEIPSAKEMEANGVQLGEMNILLLKKIEELTLYIIEQEKRIEKLEQKK